MAPPTNHARLLLARARRLAALSALLAGCPQPPPATARSSELSTSVDGEDIDLEMLDEEDENGKDDEP